MGQFLAQENQVENPHLNEWQEARLRLTLMVWLHALRHHAITCTIAVSHVLITSGKKVKGHRCSCHGAQRFGTKMILTTLLNFCRKASVNRRWNDASLLVHWKSLARFFLHIRRMSWSLFWKDVAVMWYRQSSVSWLARTIQWISLYRQALAYPVSL